MVSTAVSTIIACRYGTSKRPYGNPSDQKFVVLLRVSTAIHKVLMVTVWAAQRRDIQIFLDGLDGAPEVIREAC